MKLFMTALLVALGLTLAVGASAEADGPTPGVFKPPEAREAAALVRSHMGFGVSDAAQGGFATTAVQAPARGSAVPSPGGDLSAFVIVLISIGGALTLAGVAYAGTRLVHHRTAMS